jgi:hypothetical protein
MGVSSISENSIPAAHGDIGDYAFDWSLQSSIGRAGAIACHKVGGAAEDVVLYGETGYGEVIGPIRTTSKDPTLTDYLPADSTGGCGVNIVQRPARTNFILAASSGAVAVGDYLIPTGVVGAVIPRPAGSNIPPVARALQAVADSASERYVYAEVLTPGIGTTGHRVSGFGNNAPANNDYVNVQVANHTATATPLFVAPVAGIIRNLYVKLKTAGGAGKTLTYTVRKSSDGGGTWADTALTCSVTGTATEGADNSNKVSVSKGDLLAIRVTSADVGAADSTFANFIFE